jgi:Tyrosine phosphatase family
MTRLARALLLLAALASLAAVFQADLEITAIAPGLYRGHVPTRDADFAELKRLGIRTILDIRGNAPLAALRERRRAEQHGFAYIHVRMGFQPLQDGSGDRALAALADEGNYPLYMHCQLDRDRTSALVAAYRVQVQGWDIPSAEAEAREFGIRRYFVGLNRYVRAGGIR